MNRYQRLQTVRKLVERGDKCDKCGGEITLSDMSYDEDRQTLRNVLTPLKNTRESAKLSNMCVRHIVCHISIKETERGETIELIVELLNAQDGCHICSSQWRDGIDVEELAILNKSGRAFVVHKVCPTS